MSASSYMWLLFVPLMAFGLYRRFKRTFGRQEVRFRRMLLRMAMLTVIAGVLLTTYSTPACLVASGVGIALGIGLAFAGLALTQFEVTAEGRFYRPNGWIGLVVTALFLGRLIGRIGSLAYSAKTAPLTPFSGMQRSPLTIGLFALMASYYVAYYAGVLQRVRHVVAISADTEDVAPKIGEGESSGTIQEEGAGLDTEPDSTVRS